MCSFSNAVDDGTCLRSAYFIYSHPVFPANRKISQFTFQCGIIYGHFSISQKYFEILFLIYAESFRAAGCCSRISSFFQLPTMMGTLAFGYILPTIGRIRD